MFCAYVSLASPDRKSYTWMVETATACSSVIILVPWHQLLRGAFVLAKSSFFFYETALLRYNGCAWNCTYSKYTIWWVWAYVISCATITTAKIMNIAVTSRSILLPHAVYLFILSNAVDKMWVSLMAQMVKNLPGNAGGKGSIPGLGSSPGGVMVTHSSVLSWRNPWTEKPGGLPSIGSQRVGHD